MLTRDVGATTHRSGHQVGEEVRRLGHQAPGQAEAGDVGQVAAQLQGRSPEQDVDEDWEEVVGAGGRLAGRHGDVEHVVEHTAAVEQAHQLVPGRLVLIDLLQLLLGQQPGLLVPGGDGEPIRGRVGVSEREKGADRRVGGRPHLWCTGMSRCSGRRNWRAFMRAARTWRTRHGHGGGEGRDSAPSAVGCAHPRALSLSTSSATTPNVRWCSLVITYFSSASPLASSSSGEAPAHRGWDANDASVVCRNVWW